MTIIRSDTLTLQVTSAEQQAALTETLDLYRRLVRDLMTVAYTHWPVVGACEGNEAVKVLESLIHPTRHRPTVRYPYFSRRAPGRSGSHPAATIRCISMWSVRRLVHHAS